MSKYDGCMLAVRNVQVSKAFYQNVLQVEPTLDLGDYVVFGDFSLMAQEGWSEFCGKGTEEIRYRHHSCELYFEDDDLDAWQEHLKTFPEVEILNSLTTMPWEQRVIRIYDPDGHVVEVGDSMKVVIQKMLLAGASPEDAAEKTGFPLQFAEACLNELKGEGKRL